MSGRLLIPQHVAEQQQEEKPMEIPARLTYKVTHYDPETGDVVNSIVEAHMVSADKDVCVFKAVQEENGLVTVDIIPNYVRVQLIEIPKVTGQAN